MDSVSHSVSSCAMICPSVWWLASAICSRRPQLGAHPAGSILQGMPGCKDALLLCVVFGQSSPIITQCDSSTGNIDSVMCQLRTDLLLLSAGESAQY